MWFSSFTFLVPPELIVNSATLKGHLYIPRSLHDAQIAASKIAPKDWEHWTEGQKLAFLEPYFVVVPVDLQEMANIRGVSVPTASVKETPHSDASSAAGLEEKVGWSQREFVARMLGLVAAPRLPQSILLPEFTLLVEQAQARVRAEFKKIDLGARTALVGIGPSQPVGYVDALRVISPLLPGVLRQRLFVLTKTAAQVEELKTQGWMASNEIYDLLDQLKTRLKESGVAQSSAFYHATEEEQGALDQAAELLGVPISVLGREPGTDLTSFLKRLLASLGGITPEEVAQRVNLRQLTEDILLLIRA